MTWFTAARLHAAKELRVELRTKEILVSTGLFSALLVVLASLAFYVDPVTARALAPGVLWIPIAFAGVLASGRAWARERENGVFRAVLLAPAPRVGLYVGKTVAVFTLLLAIEVALVPLVGLFFHLDLAPVLAPLAALLAAGTFAFTSAAMLFGALTVEGRARDLLLSIVVFPLVAPALLAAVVATRELFGGAPEGDLGGWIRILLAFDLVYFVGGAALFEPLVGE